MSKPISIINSVVNKKLRCKIKFNDKELYGKEAKFRLVYEIIVHDSRPKNERKVLFKQEFIVDGVEKIIDIDLKKYRAYTYKGKMIDVNFFVDVVVNDSIFFDTKITQVIQNKLGVKPVVSSNSKAMIDPKDNFKLFDNLMAIPHDAKIIVLLLSIIGGIVMVINGIVGIHDQLVSETHTWFYSHHNSDGESSSPFFNALAIDGGIGAFLWMLIKSQLKRYMKIFFKLKKFDGARTKMFKLNEIIGGKSKVDLENVKFRVVACNMEKGEYIRGSGSNRRTVDFSNPVRAVSLFEKEVPFIPKNSEIGDYISGNFSFEQMYKSLYPKQSISKTHGLEVHWEVQMIHDKFIDQELIGPTNSFKYEYFLKG